ncbi:ORF6N domain-containing protein [Treponema sp.]|uniref:ORF6N domain-containing protein n=1 Tax=Treponema sp. TaxID=166 RepID=UPI00388EC5FA
MEKEVIINNENDLKDKIYMIRGVQVMLDKDLAEIYGYSTKAFNQQVKNNIEKFDEEDLMFQLTEEETNNLRSNFLTANISVMSRSLPYAFTEQGVYMLMTVLKGELATKQSKALVRLFKKMKDYVIENQQVVSQRDFLRLSLQTSENTQNIIEFQKQLAEIDDKVETVVSNLGDMVRKSELSPIMLNLGKPEIPAGWLILNGQPVESDIAYQQIYTLANKTIYIVDNYISLKTLILFKNAKQNVAVTIFSDNTNNGLHKVEYDDFCKEFPGLKIDVKEAGKIFHDRYNILDYGTPDEKIYHCGASSKDGGRKVTTITLTDDTSVYSGLIAQLLKNKPLVLK